MPGCCARAEVNSLYVSLIPLYGWRVSYGVLLLVMVPVGFFFFRERPEAYGLQPDAAIGDRYVLLAKWADLRRASLILLVTQNGNARYFQRRFVPHR